jgi:hypothetical protein
MDGGEKYAETDRGFHVVMGILEILLKWMIWSTPRLRKPPDEESTIQWMALENLQGTIGFYTKYRCFLQVFPESNPSNEKGQI